jgi:RimJ/RimL family protein N-acetyltransferase
VHQLLDIRPLIPIDAAAFQSLRLAALQECPEAFSSSFEEEISTPLTEIERRLMPKNDSAIFGTFDDGALVAIVGLKREGMAKLAHKAFVWGMYVAPTARSRGTGTLILRHALGYAATLGIRQVNLGVNTKNTAAVALYQKLGFVEYGLERDFMFVDGEFHDEYQMVCHVANTG